MEYITDVDYRHANRVFKAFKLTNLGQYHDLYFKNDKIQLSNVFEAFRNVCIKVYKLDETHFLSAPALAWQACLKKIGVKLELLTDPDPEYVVEYVIKYLAMQKQIINT